MDGNNAFALDIYNPLRTENGNLILSPYSISLALAMTYAGARSETETQTAQTLHFPPQDHLHPAFNVLDLALEKSPVIMEGTMARMSEVSLQIDRAFIFIIRDTVHGQILFIGRVLNPTE